MENGNSMSFHPKTQTSCRQVIYCPYKAEHRILRENDALTHVSNCRKDYLTDTRNKGQDVMFVGCKFQKNHFVPSLELEFHESFCPDRTPEKLPKPQSNLTHDQSLSLKNNKVTEISKQQQENTKTVKDNTEKMVDDYFLLYKPLGMTEQEKKTWLAKLRGSIDLTLPPDLESLESFNKDEEKVTKILRNPDHVTSSSVRKNLFPDFCQNSSHNGTAPTEDEVKMKELARKEFLMKARMPLKVDPSRVSLEEAIPRKLLQPKRFSKK